MTLAAASRAGAVVSSPDARARIAHLVAPAEFGGLESVVRVLARTQLEHNNDVAVIALLEKNSSTPPFLNSLAADRVRVVELIHPARAFFAQRRAVLAELQRQPVDVLHSHGYLPDVLSASLPAEAAPCRISTVHGFTGGGLKNRFYEWLQRRALRRLNLVVAVSDKLASELGGKTGMTERIHTIPNRFPPADIPLTRVEARRLLQLGADDFTLGWIGRISREKGLDVLIDALAELGDSRARAVIIGDGQERDSLERRAHQSLPGQVKWTGALENAGRLVSAFDALVISSRTEGTPITLLEAISAGVPVIATAVGGIPDIVTPVTAFLVAPEDPASLASAIRSVLHDPSSAAKRAEGARSAFDTEFDADLWASRYARVYSLRRAVQATT